MSTAVAGSETTLVGRVFRAPGADEREEADEQQNRESVEPERESQRRHPPRLDSPTVTTDCVRRSHRILRPYRPPAGLRRPSGPARIRLRMTPWQRGARPRRFTACRLLRLADRLRGFRERTPGSGSTSRESSRSCSCSPSARSPASSALRGKRSGGGSSATRSQLSSRPRSGPRVVGVRPSVRGRHAIRTPIPHRHDGQRAQPLRRHRLVGRREPLRELGTLERCGRRGAAPHPRQAGGSFFSRRPLWCSDSYPVGARRVLRLHPHLPELATAYTDTLGDMALGLSGATLEPQSP